MTKNAFIEKQIYFTRKFKVFALQEREKGLIWDCCKLKIFESFE